VFQSLATETSSKQKVCSLGIKLQGEGGGNRKNMINGDLNYGRTEYFGTDHLEEMQSDGNTIQPQDSFEYLRTIVKENGSSDVEIGKKKINKGLVKQEELLVC
jgi:hypothetical protein